MGLDAIWDDNSLENNESIRTVRVTDVEPNKNQPRKKFDDEEIQKLADSIRDHGLIQPIIVRVIEDERFQIVAGERRWRACKMAGINEIPIIVKEISDEETAKLALIENVQRADLNPIEEAAAYKQLIDDYGVTQEAIAKMVGKSRSVIANAVRLLNLPDEIQEMLEDGDITVGHAKALAGIEDEEIMLETARKAAKGLLTVRNIEKIASELAENEEEPVQEESDEERTVRNYYTEVEIGLSEKLGRKVRISGGKKGGGTITLDFFDKADLQEISEMLADYYEEE